MKKKLPSLYKTNSTIQNNNQIKTCVLNTDLKETKNINKQISDIFSSPKYVYKADVSINLIDGTTLKKTIIGRTNNSLITIENDLIDVSKIAKIEFN